MFCPHCGKNVIEGANFCAVCGKRLQVQAASMAAENTFAPIETGEGRVSKALNRAALMVGDLNGDGKVDAEDFKIAAEKTKKIAVATSEGAAKLGKEVMKSELAKDVAAGAALGAAIAIPVPLVGPATGAIIGAGVGAYTNITKKK